MKKFKNNPNVKMFSRIFVFFLLLMLFCGIDAAAYLLISARISVVLGIVVVAIPALLFVFLFSILCTVYIRKHMKKLEVENQQFKSIVDAVNYPIHVIDKDMNWTFMNRAFEKLMTTQGVVPNRESACGMACSNAGADICNTEKCGIRQLQKGVGVSYFDWYGMKCKQETSYLINEAGEKTGYVEVVTDLTPLLRVNDYNTTEITRIVHNLQNLAAGDLELDLSIGDADEHTTKTREEFLKINHSLIDVKDALGRLIGDADLLTKAATDGHLSVRADAERHQGSYRRIIEGFNGTLDAVIGPLNDAASCLSKISRGDIPEKITDSYNGDFNTIIENLNTCIETVNHLTEDTSLLAQAAIVGNLTVRADAGRHQGDFRRIVEGFNNTLDTIVTPINEAIAIFNAISLNDLEAEMAGHYQGTFRNLSDAINGVRSRLLSVEDAFVRVSRGDSSRLEEFKKVGKRSEHDKLMPAAIAMMQALHDVNEEANRLAAAAIAGNLGVRGDAERFEGAYRDIIEGLNQTMAAFETPVTEISDVLKHMADGDLTHMMTGDYSGEYARIKSAVSHAMQSVGEVLGSINIAAAEVSSGSKQISDSSQALSEGTTEQASSIEELSASITEIADQTKQNSRKAAQAKELALKAKEDAGVGNKHMEQMLQSITEINEASASISKIIKVIDDIAFQTNILALNAAVEAARAGQYGKGFAVVAEEVRNLAGKSANAAKDTSALIESSIQKTEAGTRIAGETAEALNEIVSVVDKAASLVSEIASASNEQATGISQINMGVEQVSKVIQTNSATAEESAAASVELSSQAEMLKNLAEKFIIGDTMAERPAPVVRTAPANRSKPAFRTEVKAKAAATGMQKANAADPAESATIRREIHLSGDMGKY